MIVLLHNANLKFNKMKKKNEEKQRKLSFEKLTVLEFKSMKLINGAGDHPKTHKPTEKGI
jgi:hypothetical protein